MPYYITIIESAAAQAASLYYAPSLPTGIYEWAFIFVAARAIVEVNKYQAKLKQRFWRPATVDVRLF